jgi:hypothetical protein
MTIPVLGLTLAAPEDGAEGEKGFKSVINQT